MMQLETFPSRVDFKPDTESVDDQKSWGSCVAHAGQTALEIAFSRARTPIDLSRAYLYHWVQKYAGTLGTKDGGYPVHLGAIIENNGCCLEVDWPYDKAGTIPPESIRAMGQSIFPANSTKYTRLRTVEQIKRALCMGKPVVFGMVTHQSFSRLSGPWTAHAWDITAPQTGGHAVCCIGYDDQAKRLLCENSWGSQWGDGGFFGMPYAFVDGRSVVLEAYCWDMLPVPAVRVDGYIPASTPLFTTIDNTVSIPSLDWYPGNFAPVERRTNVRIKVLTPGQLSWDVEVAKKIDTPSFLAKNGDQTAWELMLPLLSLDGKEVYAGVLQRGAQYEFL
jgi:hypothetical protein